MPHAVFVLSISAISQLLLTRFWPNFKHRFLGPSLTHPNCHGDICAGNICPVDICPYREYLSCYWPNFDQTLVSFLGPSLTDVNCHGDICPGHIWPGDICPYQQYRQHLTWRHLSISAISQLLWNQFWPNFKGRFVDICPGNICPDDIGPWQQYPKQ